METAQKLILKYTHISLSNIELSIAPLYTITCCGD